MLTVVKKQLKVMLLSIKYNIMREMTNRTTFFTNIIFMILNNASFIVQWIVLFSIREEIGGYQLNDVLLLWGLAAGSYGFAHLLFEGSFELTNLIINGKLDSFLVQPKSVLLGVITSKTKISAIGDLIYGYLILLLTYNNITSFLLFTLFAITGGLIVTALAIIFGSLSFWLGKTDALAYSLNSIILHVSTYPDGIFKGIIKIILYTVIPVGILAYLPVRVMQGFDIGIIAIIIFAAIFLVFLAFITFNKGLRRYSSSNLMIARI